MSETPAEMTAPAPRQSAQGAAAAHESFLRGTVASFDPETYEGVVNADDDRRCYFSRQTAFEPDDWTPQVNDAVLFQIGKVRFTEDPAIACMQPSGPEKGAQTQGTRAGARRRSKLSEYFGGRFNLGLTAAGYLILLACALAWLFS